LTGKARYRGKRPHHNACLFSDKAQRKKMLREFRYRLAYWSGVRPQPQELELGQADVQHGAAFKFGDYRVSAHRTATASDHGCSTFSSVLSALSPQSAIPSNGRMPSGITDGCSNGGYTYAYPGVGEHNVEISAFMLPLTAPQ